MTERSEPPAAADIPAETPAAGAATPGRIERARSLLARSAEYADRYWPGRLWSRLLEVEFVDRSIALAAKAFVSLFPFIIVVAAIVPDRVRAEIMQSLAVRFGLAGSVSDAIKAAFASPAQTRSAAGIFGVVLTLAFAVSFTTALQRVFLRAWRRPPGGGLKNKGRGAMWVAGIGVLMVLLALVRRVLTGWSGDGLTWLVGLLGAIALWWWTARLMTRSEIRWRPLLPTAVVCGVGSWLYTLVAAIWMPRNLASHFAQFGAFGISLAFVTWFTGLAFLLVGAAVLGPVLSESESRLARWLRGAGNTVVADGAPAPLPGPVRPLRISDAFARNRDGGIAEPDS
jgi:membrane protein